MSSNVPTAIAPPVLVAPPAPTSGATRKVYVGHTVQDVYIRGGKHLGPGTVELPYGSDQEIAAFNDFVKCVRRVQDKRAPEHRVNLDAIDTPPPKQLTQATAEELRAALAALGQPVDSVVTPDTAPAAPLPVTTGIAPSSPATPQFIPAASFVPTSAAPVTPPNVPTEPTK